MIFYVTVMKFSDWWQYLRGISDQDLRSRSISTFFILQKFKNSKPSSNPTSVASLHVINSISELISDDLITSLGRYSTCKDQICEDALVYLRNIPSRKTLGGYAGLILTSAPSFNVVMQWNGSVESICPASGKFVYWPRCRDGERTFSRSRIVVIDLFWIYYSAVLCGSARLGSDTKGNKTRN